ncbi:MAG: Homoserine O-acetyltransferase [Betaproteobacteria bacterium ADurb.Bin341]|nr:MAG: Homoserine O-acetyltransferase [Betaproteobacteria bacterium ADurb.Bin341]
MKRELMRHLLVAVAALAFTAAAQGGEMNITGTCALPVKDICDLKQSYDISGFRLGGKYDLDKPESWQFGGEGGTTLESLGMPPLRVSYIAVGTPRYNDRGEINNAIVINSYYSGDAANMYNFWVKGHALSGEPLIGKGRLFDTDKYYIVMVDAIGLWGASKPSNGLGLKFPQYSNFDLVQANYRLLRDKLNVGQVELVTGVSMGGTQSWVWGVMHSASGFVKAIMPIGGTTGSDSAGDPLTKWVFGLMTSAIKSDPVWQKTNGDYYHLPKEQHPLMGVAFGWSVLNHTGFDFAFRASQPMGTVEPLIFDWEPKGKQASGVIAQAKNFDAVDLVYRNNAGDLHNVNKELGRIKARTLVIHVENDQWLVMSKAKAAAAKVPGAGFASFRDKFAHYAVFKAPNELKATIAPFIADKWTAGATVASVAPMAAASAPAAKPAGLSK